MELALEGLQGPQEQECPLTVAVEPFLQPFVDLVKLLQKNVKDEAGRVLEYKERLLNKQKELEEGAAQHDAVVEELHTLVDSLREEIVTGAAEHAKSSDRLKGKEAEIEQLRTEIVQAGVQSLSALQERSRAFEQERAHHRVNIEGLEEDLARVTGLESEAKKRCESLQSQLTAAQANADRAQEEKVSQEEKLRAQQEEIQTLLKTLEAAKRQNTADPDPKVRYKAMQGARSCHQQGDQSLRKGSSSESSLTHEDHQETTTHRRSSRLQNTLASGTCPQQQIQSLQTRLGQLKQRCEVLQTSELELRSQLKIRDEKINSLAKHITSTAAENGVSDSAQQALRILNLESQLSQRLTQPDIQAISRDAAHRQIENIATLNMQDGPSAHLLSKAEIQKAWSAKDLEISALKSKLQRQIDLAQDFLASKNLSASQIDQLRGELKEKARQLEKTKSSQVALVKELTAAKEVIRESKDRMAALEQAKQAIEIQAERDSECILDLHKQIHQLKSTIHLLTRNSMSPGKRKASAMECHDAAPESTAACGPALPKRKVTALANGDRRGTGCPQASFEGQPAAQQPRKSQNPLILRKATPETRGRISASTRGRGKVQKKTAQ